MKNRILVLLSTYNGEDYIKEQLESVLNQKGVDLDILVRDDGSTDGTIQILEEYHKEAKLQWYSSDNIGAGKSFFNLLLESPVYKYYAFCDQDDVWYPEKLLLSMAKMTENEKKYADRPIIIHTDMNVVDENLTILHPSFWQMSRFRPEILNTFTMLAACNGINGCTMLMNNNAKSLVCNKYFEQDIVIHDVFCSLVVSYNNGIIDYVSEPTMAYRQHSSNVVGAQTYSPRKYLKKIKSLKNTVQDNILFFKLLNQIGHISPFNYIFNKFKYLLIR